MKFFIVIVELLWLFILLLLQILLESSIIFLRVVGELPGSSCNISLTVVCGHQNSIMITIFHML